MDRRHFLKTVGQAAAVAAASKVVPARADLPDRLTLAAVGDCLISRKVSDRKDTDFLEIVELLRGADCVWGNCELVLADANRVYPAVKGGDPHGICPPWGADELAWMGIGFAGTANNHILDFGNEGLFQTLENLDRAGIVHAGSGADLARAAAPAYIDTPAGRVAQVNCCSTFLPYFAAGPAHPYLRGRPGLNPLRYEETILVPPKLFQELKRIEKPLADLQGAGEFEDFIEEIFGKTPEDETYLYEARVKVGSELDILSSGSPGDVQRVTDAIKVARNNAGLVLATIHSHEARHKLELNAPFLQPFARACIDAGADAFFSAGPHLLRGIEIYKGKPIFYCLGNFIFQYETIQPVPSESFTRFGLDANTLDSSLYALKIPYHKQKRFWRSLVPRITFEGNRVVEIELHPLSLGFGKPLYERGTPVRARGEEALEILRNVAALSQPYGTMIEIDGEVGRVVPRE
jgi:poly-gamma-glutamate capsule biosynthesis protein CapA/YwtB (metallophosphatase superfamily)